MFSQMSLKAPAITQVKTQRGIMDVYVADQGGYLIRVPVFEPLVDVRPGQENAVPVKIAPLPPNANVEEIEARLHVGTSAQTPEAQTTTVAITKNGKANDPASGSFAVAVDQPLRPSNVRLQFPDGEVFWTFGGVLTEEAYDLPDFAAALNAYLDLANRAEPLTELPFLCASDTFGKVGIEIVALSYSQVRTQTWPNPLDTTTRVDRNLSLAFGATERLPLDPLTEGGGAVQLQAITLDVGGEFGPDRLLGDVEQHDGRQFATVSGDYALAQGFVLRGELVKGPRRCTGVACYFTAEGGAELYVELQPDARGFPAAGAPLASANLTFAPLARGEGRQPWTFARFASTAELEPDRPYWIVVKGVRGSAWLGLQAEPGSDESRPVARTQLSMNRGGQVWKGLFRVAPTPPIVAMLGVVYLPGRDDQTAAVQLTVTGGPAQGPPVRRRLDPGREPQTVALDLGGIDWSRAVLEIRSQAEGTLSVANVIREYRLAESR